MTIPKKPPNGPPERIFIEGVCYLVIGSLSEMCRVEMTPERLAEINAIERRGPGNYPLDPTVGKSGESA